ncbi:MAG: hypothetical protein EOP56_09190 [Sphingobacteriales bacterium]|nr:MAG: hypothetical protein EOP56_09190 [Sphingobacteriales bacterium]
MKNLLTRIISYLFESISLWFEQDKEPVELSVKEFESMLLKGIAESRNDFQIDNCIDLIKRYKGEGAEYEAAIARLDRAIILKRYLISTPVKASVKRYQLS